MNASGLARDRARVARLRWLTYAERWLARATTGGPRPRGPRLGGARLGRPSFGRPRLGRPTLRSLFSLRGLAALAAVALLLGLGWLWFRSSSFVQIRQVQVTGLSGPNLRRIRGALVDTARSMTTLDLSVARLDSAVAGYPAVRSLRVHTQFPHGVTIAVNEQVPLALVAVGGKLIVVDSNGQLLPGSTIPHGMLPRLQLRTAPTGQLVTAPGARAALAALAWAPDRVLGHIASATWNAAHGVIIRLRNGPDLYLGGSTQLPTKWTAAITVLADPGSKGAQYIDVSDPRRPAAGALAPTGG